MNIYQELDYRSVLAELLKERKLIDPHFTNSSLSEKAKIQKTYLSAVLAKKSHLSSDQLYLALTFLNKSEKEFQYLNLLCEWERTQVLPRKKLLFARIQSIQNRELTTGRHLSAEEVPKEYVEKYNQYYLDPFNILVHYGLMLEPYSNNPSALKKVLGLSSPHFQKCLDLLESLEIIQSTGAHTFLVKVKYLHLPKDSPLCIPHQQGLRSLAVSNKLRDSHQNDYNFMATFCADEQTRIKIHALFLDFLKTIESLVKKAPNAKVFQINFELFQWL